MNVSPADITISPDGEQITIRVHDVTNERRTWDRKTDRTEYTTYTADLLLSISVRGIAGELSRAILNKSRESITASGAIVGKAQHIRVTGHRVHDPKKETTA